MKYLIFIFPFFAWSQDCTTDWSAQKLKIERLRTLAECNSFGNLNECRINAGIMSEFEKTSAEFAATRISAAMTYAQIKCAGVPITKTSPFERKNFIELLLAEAYAQTGCYRALKAFQGEALFAMNSAERALKEAQKMRLLQLWAQKNQLSQSAVQELLYKFTRNDNVFTAVEGAGTTKGKAHFHRIQGYTVVKTGTQLSTVAQLESEFVAIMNGQGFVANSSKDPTLQSLKQSMIQLKEVNASLSQKIIERVGEDSKIEKISGVMKDLFNQMKALSEKYPNIRPLADVKGLAHHLSQAWDNRSVCVSKLEMKPTNIWAQLLIEPAQAGLKICSLASRTTGSGINPGVAANTAKAGTTRLLASRLISGANWAGLIYTGYELGAWGIDNIAPCETSSQYLTGQKRATFCSPSITIESLKSPPFSANENIKKTQSALNMASFFDLSEEEQKKEFGNPEFCKSFNSLYSQKFMSRQILCGTDNEVFVMDKNSAINHEIKVNENQQITEIASSGSGLPSAASSIIRFNDDEVLKEVEMFAGTKSRPKTLTAKGETFNFSAIREKKFQSKTIYTSNYQTVLNDMGVILESVGCCTGKLNRSDSLGRCQNVQKGKLTPSGGLQIISNPNDSAIK